jgi:hypothetical protein
MNICGTDDPGYSPTYWYQADFPVALLIFTFGSANPRTPGKVPKYYRCKSGHLGQLHALTWLNERFSNMTIMTCLTSLRDAAFAAVASASSSTVYADIVAVQRTLGNFETGFQMLRECTAPRAVSLESRDISRGPFPDLYPNKACARRCTLLVSLPCNRSYQAPKRYVCYKFLLVHAQKRRKLRERSSQVRKGSWVFFTSAKAQHVGYLQGSK